MDRFTGYTDTAGKVYGAASILLHIGRAVGTAVRCAAPLLGQIRDRVGTPYATAKHYAQRLDQGVNLASRDFAAARPVLKDIAPTYKQKATKGAA